jgi:hypothetical protein
MVPRSTLLADTTNLGLAWHPWLFFRDGWDWRYWTWGETERRIADLVAAFGVSQASVAGHRVGLPRVPSPELVALHCALEAVGALGVPLYDRAAAEEAHLPLWVELAGDGSPRVAVLGTEVTTPETASELALRSEWELALALDRLVLEVTSSSPRRDTRREIVVDALPFGSPQSRAGWRWLLWRRGVAVLAPSPASFVDVVSWARPTLLWASGSQVDALWTTVRAIRVRFRRRRRLARLRLVLCFGEAPASEASAGLRELGVVVELWSRPADTVFFG